MPPKGEGEEQTDLTLTHWIDSSSIQTRFVLAKCNLEVEQSKLSLKHMVDASGIVLSTKHGRSGALISSWISFQLRISNSSLHSPFCVCDATTKVTEALLLHPWQTLRACGIFETALKQAWSKNRETMDLTWTWSKLLPGSSYIVNQAIYRGRF